MILKSKGIWEEMIEKARVEKGLLG